MSYICRGLEIYEHIIAVTLLTTLQGHGYFTGLFCGAKHLCISLYQYRSSAADIKHAHFSPPGGFGFCLIDGSCQTTDASWVESQLPSLQVGQEISVSTTSSSFGFYLGNSLTGTMEVSLTPVFQTQGITHFVDELTANIANRTAVFSTTHDGHLTFEAVSGSDYYLLLSGLMRGETHYQLQLSQVPLPAGFYLFSSGLMMLLRFGRKRSGAV